MLQAAGDRIDRFWIPSALPFGFEPVIVGKHLSTTQSVLGPEGRHNLCRGLLGPGTSTQNGSRGPKGRHTGFK